MISTIMAQTWTSTIDSILRLPEDAVWNLSQRDRNQHLVRGRKPVGVPSKDRLSRLPDLCKRLILEYLPGSDVASLRLASRTWTTIAVEGLLNIAREDGTIEPGVYTLRLAWPNRKDDELKAIASRPWMAKHVKHLRVFTSDVDIECLEKWVQKHPLHESLLVYQEMHENAVVHPGLKNCNLQDVSPHLVDLEKVSIKSMEWPFKAATKEIQALEEQFVRKYWDSFVMDNIRLRNNFQALNVDMSSHLAILEAVASNKKPMKSLDIDLLATDLFLHGTVIDPAVRTHLFAKLEDLKLGLSVCTMASYYGTILAGLNALLGETKQLKRLELKWHSHKTSRPYHHGLYQDRMKSWQISFLQLHWDNMEELRLDNLFVKDPEAISAFVCSHKSMLKRLSLLRCLPCERDRDDLTEEAKAQAGPVKTFLTKLRDELKLESFQVSLKCREDDDRTLKRVESFVLRQKDWPSGEGHIRCRCHW
ncbi:uncharacterized protein PAC_05288 [Phialocephala subalpina]|uniref:F-box domain-containing protein n=1 Tax=Phialocephala subalpina TaxID=576137 RepID=A0A1L7WRL0_9HELO|nr:uncharacterized protein PAC_05288 [Phialocephala subalpina]